MRPPTIVAATLPRSRAGFILRALSAGIGAMTMLLYTKLIPWP